MKLKVFIITIVLVFASTALAQKETTAKDARCWNKRDFGRDCAERNARHLVARLRDQDSTVLAVLLYRFMKQAGVDADKLGMGERERAFVLDAIWQFENGPLTDSCGRMLRRVGSDDDLVYDGTPCKTGPPPRFKKRINFN